MVSLIISGGGGDGGGARQLSASEKDQVREVFQRIDIDDSGTLELEEVQVAFSEMGMPSDEASIKKLFAATDLDSDGAVTLQEFEAVYAANPKGLGGHNLFSGLIGGLEMSNLGFGSMMNSSNNQPDIASNSSSSPPNNNPPPDVTYESSDDDGDVFEAEVVAAMGRVNGVNGGVGRGSGGGSSGGGGGGGSHDEENPALPSTNPVGAWPPLPREVEALLSFAKMPELVLPFQQFRVSCVDDVKALSDEELKGEFKLSGMQVKKLKLALKSYSPQQQQGRQGRGRGGGGSGGEGGAAANAVTAGAAAEAAAADNGVSFPPGQNKFKAGDYVTWKGSDEDVPVGTVGTVSMVHDDGDVEVEFGKNKDPKQQSLLFTFKPERLDPASSQQHQTQHQKHPHQERLWAPMTPIMDEEEPGTPGEAPPAVARVGSAAVSAGGERKSTTTMAMTTTSSNNSSNSKLSAADVAKVRKVFNRIDFDGSGTLDHDEVHVVQPPSCDHHTPPLFHQCHNHH
jgi:Ca2+-binding EF-hand superfamily protein